MMNPSWLAPPRRLHNPCLLAALALSWACNGGSPINIPDGVNIPGLLVAGPSQLSLEPGQKAAISAELHLPDGSTQPTDTPVAWTSSDASVAGIDPYANVVGLAAGNCEVTAHWQGLISNAISVQVSASDANGSQPTAPGNLASLTLNPQQATLQPGEQVQFLVDGATSSGGPCAVDSPVNWLSSATGTVAIDANGLATGVAAGSASITAAVGATASAPAPVTVTHGPVVSVALVGPPSNLSVGTDAQLQAQATLFDGTIQPAPAALTYQSSDSAVLAIDGNGLIFGQGSGSASITALLSGHTSPPATIVVDPVVTVIADFSTNSASLGPDWGGWQDTHGGANNDGTQSVIYNATGLAGNALEIDYTLDSGVWGFASVLTHRTATIDLNARGISRLVFDWKGTGSATVDLCLDTPLVGAANAFSRYCTNLGAAPAIWTHHDLDLNALAWTSTPSNQNYTLHAGLGSAQGFVWQASGGGGLVGSLLLDNVTVVQTQAATGP